jgi:hypothetical protein
MHACPTENCPITTLLGPKIRQEKRKEKKKKRRKSKKKKSKKKYALSHIFKAKLYGVT